MRIKIRHILALATCLQIGMILFPLKSLAQKKWSLRYLYVDQNPSSLPTKALKVRYDSILAIKEIQKHVADWQTKGHLLANLDSIFFKNDTLFAHIFIGECTKWNRTIVPTTSLGTWLSKNKNFNLSENYVVKEWKRQDKTWLDYFENNGFPFAYLETKDVQKRNDTLQFLLDIQPGPFIVLDSVKVLGNLKIRNAFLTKYLNLSLGQPFDQRKFSQAEILAKQLPYAQMNQPSYLYFKNNKVTYFLYLQERKSNQADGVIGFLPNSGNNNSFLFTGEVNLLLRNLFSRGLGFKGEWRSFQSLSQSLGIEIFYPNVLGSALDVDGQFNFLRQDSTFRTLQYQLKFSYKRGAFSKFSLFAGVKTSDLIALNLYKNATVLPPVADFTYTYYGLGYTFNQLDDFYYPKRGWTLQMDGSLGNKVIRKNAQINEAAYTNVAMISTQFTFNLSIEKYTRVYKNLIFYYRTKAGWIENPTILRNDMYRIGGLKSLRGFNENDYFANNYMVTNLELRQFTDPGSYVFVFYDQGFYTLNTSGIFKQDIPYGFGAGISLTTNAGVFTFAYGLGQSKDQNINFNLSKIHFGYLSRF